MAGHTRGLYSRSASEVNAGMKLCKCLLNIMFSSQLTIDKHREFKHIVIGDDLCIDRLRTEIYMSGENG